MKNFRKVLALILVVATLFSFAAMIGAREVGDYTDYDKVNYQEAVDVLTAIGILDGYTDGSFQPTSTITRAEMAKMIAVLYNAGTDIKNLYAGSCKFADSKDNWAASYIAYCANTGIVAGRNATTFDPNGKVTGVETAKMLLCVLGFDAAYQNYVGTNWMTYVMADAKNYGLLDGFAADYAITAAITREEAAQMMLNALKANMVIGTLSDSIIKLSNALYIDLFTEEYGKVNGIDVGFTVKDAQKYGWIVLDGNVIISPVPLYSIYDGLVYNGLGQDCYGNPSIVWTYANSKGTVSTIGSYPLAATYSSTTKVDFANVLKEEEKSSKTYVVDLYVDGKLEEDSTDGDTVDTVDWDYYSDLTGKGVETHVYVEDRFGTEGGEVYGRIVVTIKYTYIGEVDTVYKAANTFTIANTAYKFSNKGYDFAEGDIILYWLCGEDGDDLHDAKIATPVTITASKHAGPSKDTGYVTSSDNKSYEYAYNLGVVIDPFVGVMGQTQVALSKNDGATWDLYLDEFGYIMYWARHNDAVNYVYAYAYEGSGRCYNYGMDGYGHFTCDNTYEVVTYTGNKSLEKIDVDHPFYQNAVQRLNNREIGALVEYTVNADGVAEYSRKAHVAWDNFVLNKNGTISNDFGTFYCTDDTQFMVRTWDYAKGEYVYNVYTRKTLPASYKGYVLGETWDGDAGFRRVATIQYFLDAKGFTTYVFVDATFELTSVTAFVYGEADPYTFTDSIFVNQIGSYDVYNAYIGGEDALLLYTRNSVNNKLATYHMYELEAVATGLYVDGKQVYTDAAIKHADGVGAIEDYNGALLFGTDKAPFFKFESGKVYYPAEECKIVLFVENTSTGKLSPVECETVEEVNDYLESRAAIIEHEDDIYYGGRYWLVTNDNDEVVELYAIVRVNEA